MSRRVTLGARSASPAATTRIAFSSSSSGRLLSAKPLAPARSASKTYSSRSKAVRMSTRAPPGARAEVICRVASIPSITGIRTSITTTSGARLAARSTACLPSAASPTTCRSFSASISEENAVRSNAWSSTTRTPVIRVPPGSPPRPLRVRRSPRVLDRDLGEHVEAAAERFGHQPATEGADPLPHPDDPVAWARNAGLFLTGRRAALDVARRPPGWSPVVGHLEPDLRGRDRDVDRGPGLRRMPDDVGERLLDHAIERELKGVGELTIGARRSQLDGCPRRPHGVRELFEVSEPRRGRERGSPGFLVAQQPEHDPQLVLGGPPDHLDRLERGARLLGALRHQAPAHPGLDGDHRERVGDDVVQLAG